MSTQPRSTFVSAIAWIFIILAGFATLISALQNVMIQVMFPAAEMQKAVDQAAATQGMPAFAIFMFNNVKLIFLGFFFLAVVTLASAIGLLMRKNWARLVFVALLAFGILWNVGGVVLAFFIFESFSALPSTMPADFADQFTIMSRIIIGVNLLMAAAFTFLFGWIIKRLVSEDIRREFLAA